MTLHATRALGDAFRATKTLLLPFDGGTWLRVAVMAFFIRGFGASTVGSNVRFSGSPDEFSAVGAPDVGFPLPAAVAAVGLLGLLWLYLGSVMEFVLVETLRTREARVRARFRAFTGLGARLFGVRLLLFALAATLVGGAVAPVLLTGGIGWLVLLAPIVLLVLPVIAVVNGFTTVFVVPVMLRERCGVVAGWRRFYAGARGHLDEYGVYLLVSVVLTWAGGALVGAVVGVIGGVLFLPFGLATLYAVLTGGGPALLALLPLLVGAFLVVLAVAAVVRVPVLTYLRYYALFVLGGTTEYDLLDEVRADIDPGIGDEHADGPDPADLG